MDQTQPEALNLEQAAKVAGIGRSTLYSAMGSGELPSFKVGRRRLVRRDAIAAWLARLESQAMAGGHGLKAPSRPLAAAG